MSIMCEPLYKRLLDKSPLSSNELHNLIMTAPSRYKEHYIQKRNGRGDRLISQPTAELKFFQRFLIDFELRDLPIHDAAKAYRKNCSIANHAIPHAASKYLLKLDFKDFFPSLSELAIRSVVAKLDRYSEGEQWIICQLFCRQRLSSPHLHLSVGAPSSPFLSNALMYEFDVSMARACIENKVVYTRYADDIALSTSVPLNLDWAHGFVRVLIDQLAEPRLTLNEAKTVNVSRKHRRVLTGLTLSNKGNVSIGRVEKRILSAAIHALASGRVPEMGVSRLRGMMAFVYSIDPDWVDKMCRRYRYSSIAAIETARVDHS